MTNPFKNKGFRVIFVIVTTMIITITALLISPLVYIGLNKYYCQDYARKNEASTGLPESMGYYSLYDPCMEEGGLGGF